MIIKADFPLITIDGPTASGKGSLALQVAARLGFHLLDSGALYRLVALQALRAGVTAEQVERLVELAHALPARFDDEGHVWLHEESVTDAIRAEAVGNLASAIAALPALREALVARQRAFALPPGLVADGRDMGTVIFPQAPLKVFLTASAEKRAERCYKQLIEKGFSANLATLLQDLQARDARDMNRAVAPLKPAEDAFMLDNSDLSIEASVEQVLAWYAERCC